MGGTDDGEEGGAVGVGAILLDVFGRQDTVGNRALRILSGEETEG